MNKDRIALIATSAVIVGSSVAFFASAYRTRKQTEKLNANADRIETIIPNA